ncbi:hypothetical protein CLM82_30500, partial [Streptomyces albidoflavus]
AKAPTDAKARTGLVAQVSAAPAAIPTRTQVRPAVVVEERAEGAAPAAGVPAGAGEPGALVRGAGGTRCPTSRWARGGVGAGGGWS